MQMHLLDLQPYRGTQPRSNELLVLTESFYIEDVDEELTPEAWYSEGTGLLEPHQRGYVNYASIFAGNKRADGTWRKSGCTIYQNLEWALRKAGFPPIHNMLDYCTLGTCFLRPAINGQSLQIKPLDIQISKSYITDLVRELRPAVLICASSKAYHTVVKHLALNCRVVHVSHPACVWWNRDNGVHGREKFIEAAKQYLHESPVTSPQSSPTS